MSVTKRMLIDIPDEYHAVAYSILKKLGCIKECDICENYYVFTGDLTNDLYAKATAMLKRDYPKLKNFSLFHEEIKLIEQNSGIDSLEEHIEEIHYKRIK